MWHQPKADQGCIAPAQDVSWGCGTDGERRDGGGREGGHRQTPPQPRRTNHPGLDADALQPPSRLWPGPPDGVPFRRLIAGSGCVYHRLARAKPVPTFSGRRGVGCGIPAHVDHHGGERWAGGGPTSLPSHCEVAPADARHHLWGGDALGLEHARPHAHHRLALARCGSGPRAGADRTPDALPDRRMPDGPGRGGPEREGAFHGQHLDGPDHEPGLDQHPGGRRGDLRLVRAS